MTTLEQLKKYQEILRKNELPSGFNFWAFIFNSFYYVWKDLGTKKFLIYAAATPLLFVLLFLIKVPPFHALFFSIIVVRLTAGMRANQDIHEHMKKFVAKYKDTDLTPQPVVYFSISLTRLFFASLFTFGFYDLYWAYKNWDAIRQYTKNFNIVPVCRSWFFGVFFIYPLFLQMKKSFSTTNPIRFSFQFCAIVYTLLYVMTAILTSVWRENGSDALLNVLYLLSFISTICLLPIQKAINDHNRKLNPDSKPLQTFLPGEMATIIFSVFLAIISFASGYKSTMDKFQNNPLWTHDELRQSITIVYIHQYGYPNVCRANGYEMKNYPEAFTRFYQKEKQELEQKLAELGLTPKQAIENLGDIYRDEIDHLIKKQLKDAQQMLTENMKPGEDSTPFENTHNLCAYIDANADFFVYSLLTPSE